MLPSERHMHGRNMLCSTCHSSTHGLRVVSGLPDDIPLYPGLKWTSPVQLSLWKGEPWLSFDPTGYMIIISNRSRLLKDVVWNFYIDSMESNGWIRESASPNIGNNGFSLSFDKNGRKVTIWFYGSEDHSGIGTVTTGSRIEISFTP
jgi:hypothetical protein